MRYFNSKTKTEAIPGLHDMTGCTPLDDDSWFFAVSRLPMATTLGVEDGKPVLLDSSGNVITLTAAQAAEKAAKKADPTLVV